MLSSITKEFKAEHQNSHMCENPIDSEEYRFFFEAPQTDFSARASLTNTTSMNSFQSFRDRWKKKFPLKTALSVKIVFSIEHTPVFVVVHSMSELICFPIEHTSGLCNEALQAPNFRVYHLSQVLRESLFCSLLEIRQIHIKIPYM